MCDAHQHCIFFAVLPLPPPQREVMCAHSCTFVHICARLQSSNQQGPSWIPTITSHHTIQPPIFFHSFNIEIWHIGNLTIFRNISSAISAQENNQAMSTPQCIIQHLVILCSSWNQANARAWIFSKWSDAQFWLLHSSTTYSESWTSSAWTNSPLYPPTIRKT